MKLIKNLSVFAFVCGLLFVGGTEASAYPGGGAVYHSNGVDDCLGCHGNTTDFGSCLSMCHSQEGSDGADNATNGDGAMEPAPAGHGDAYGQNCASCHEEQVDPTKHASDDCAQCHQGAGTYNPDAQEHGAYHGEDDASCLGCHSQPTDEAEKADLGDCKSCHSESGSTPVPPGHGNDFGQNCASCHESQMADAGHATNECATCHQGAGTYDPNAAGGTSAPAAPPGHELPENHMSGFANNVGADNADGQSCDDCHSFHLSEDPDYLTTDMNGDDEFQSGESCLRCHDDKETPTTGHSSTSDCSKCHNMHSESTKDTTADDSECATCHADIAQVPGMEFHESYLETNTCTTCHSTKS